MKTFTIWCETIISLCYLKMEMSSATKNSEYKWGCFACLATTYMHIYAYDCIYPSIYCADDVG